MSRRRAGARTLGRLEGAVGGGARLRVIAVLAAALALDSADKATVGADSTQLQAALNIGRTDIGLLLAVSSLAGALATVPGGILTDRVERTRLLSGAVLCWAVAVAASGFVDSFGALLLTRLALGVVTGVASPAVASLIGDYFPERERGRIYGYVLSGELLGAVFGFAVTGEFATLSWRAPFFVMVVPTLAVAAMLLRLREPARDGSDRLIAQAREEDADAPGAPSGRDGDAPDATGDVAHELSRSLGIEPRHTVVLDEDPTDWGFGRAVRHILAVRSNLVLILASTLGYFFFTGLRGFWVEFAKQHYGVPQSAATSMTLLLGAGAITGALAGGRIADTALMRGRLTARIEVPGAAVLLAGALFVPALITTMIWLAVPLLTGAAFFLGAANPPLDAARLDIMVPRLRGRAESARTVLRDGGDALAPTLFGFVSTAVFLGDSGLEYTFLLMLGTLLAAGVVLLVWGRRAYPRDVAAVASSSGPARHNTSEGRM